MKKYRLLKDDDESDKKQVHCLVDQLNDEYVEVKDIVSSEYVLITPYGHDYPIYKVLKYRVVEVKEEPKTFEDIMIEKYGSDWWLRDDYGALDIEDMCERTIKNERLKHKPKFGFEEWWWDKILDMHPKDRPILSFPIEAAREAWNACLKSHGLKE